MPLPAHTPTERVEALIALTRSLSDLMERENGLLAARRPGDIKDLAEEKNRLAAIYAHEIRAIARNRELIGGVAPELSEQLKAFTTTLEARTARQTKAIARARRITEGAIKAIVDEAMKQDAPAQTYGERTGSAYGAPQPTSLALNQVV